MHEAAGRREPEGAERPVPVRSEVAAARAPAPIRRSARPLVVGAADDPAERDADRVADEVMSRLQTGPAPGLPIGAASSRVQRGVAPGVMGPEGGAIDPGTEAAIRSARGGGRPIDARVRLQMEESFGGADFGGVRVHTGSEASRVSRQIGARAFTLGSDVFFGADQYRPDTADGAHTLAHELAHVTQEGGSRVGRVQRLMDVATYQGSTVGPGRRGGSKASDIDALLTQYTALKDTDADFTQRKTLLDTMKTKTQAYQVAKPTGARTAGVHTLEGQLDLELTFVAPAADSIAQRSSNPLNAARRALVAQDAYIAAAQGGLPIPQSQKDPNFDRLITSAMNAGDRPAIGHALAMDDLAKIKAIAADASTSDLMKAILTEILANENDIAFGEGAISSGATVSTPKQKAATGKDYKVDLNIASNPLGSSERVSSMVHEMTHISVQTTFKNTAIHLAFAAGDSDATVLALSAKRTKQLSDLDAALTTGIASFNSSQESLLRGKIAYPVTGKNTLQSYADTFFKKKDLSQAEYDRVTALAKAGANNTLIEFDTVINQMLFLVQQWKIPATNAFAALLETVAREAYTHRSTRGVGLAVVL